MIVEAGFNSIVVRLKVVRQSRKWDGSVRFQFHSGSIKSIARVVYGDDGVVFQFHSGSIKSKEARVKRITGASFNSIVVRLKADCHWPMLDRYPMFQFHSGSIKRVSVAFSSWRWYRRFNSIVVRLKECLKGVASIYEQSFNSIVVRLKGESHQRHLARWLKFQFHSGSIKSDDICLWPDNDVPFQFHSGSIKSQPDCCCQQNNTVVSIP